VGSSKHNFTMSNSTSHNTSTTDLPEDVEFRAETFREHLWRRAKDNPAIPIGFSGVLLSLYMASRRMREQKSLEMNYWLRARVITQGFTILAITWSTGVWERLFPGTAQVRPGLLGPLPAVGILEGEEARQAQFNERMRRAEEAHKTEMAEESTSAPKKILISSKKRGSGNPKVADPKVAEEGHDLSGGYWRWLRWGNGSKEGNESSNIPPPPPSQLSPPSAAAEGPKPSGSWLRWVSSGMPLDKDKKS